MNIHRVAVANSDWTDRAVLEKAVALIVLSGLFGTVVMVGLVVSITRLIPASSQ